MLDEELQFEVKLAQGPILGRISSKSMPDANTHIFTPRLHCALSHPGRKKGEKHLDTFNDLMGLSILS